MLTRGQAAGEVGKSGSFGSMVQGQPRRLAGEGSSFRRRAVSALMLDVSSSERLIQIQVRARLDL
jgi:hypothetical protein